LPLPLRLAYQNTGDACGEGRRTCGCDDDNEAGACSAEGYPAWGYLHLADAIMIVIRQVREERN
jgi:hypothetical protein